MVNEQRLVETFLMLARINSPSLKEAEAMDAAGAVLERLGFSVERDDAGKAMGGNTGNLIARRAGTTGAPPVFFNAHIDTVQPTPDIHIIQKDGVISTDGSTILGADDKAGVACILEALESLREEGVPTGEIEVILTIAEEIGLMGSKFFDATRIHARSGWVVDSGQPLNAITVNAPSQDKLHMTFHGRAAHAGARPEEGVSAITAAGKAIATMPQGRIDIETTANVGVIQGGQATNIVPPTCELWAEARSRSEEKLKAQVDAMGEAARKAAEEMGATVDVDIERIFSAFNAEPDSREVLIASEAMRRLGMEPSLTATGGGMDANNFAEKGMRCAVIGCGYRNIHTTDENIPVADMATGARIVEAIMHLTAEAKD